VLPAPQVPPQVPVLMHETLHESPQLKVQLGPWTHWNVQLSPHCAVQLLAKPRQVGAHDGAGPQLRLHGPASMQEQEEGEQAASGRPAPASEPSGAALPASEEFPASGTAALSFVDEASEPCVELASGDTPGEASSPWTPGTCASPVEVVASGREACTGISS
jgi:hypothetical protein